jgi:hypothetical protein
MTEQKSVVINCLRPTHIVPKALQMSGNYVNNRNVKKYWLNLFLNPRRNPRIIVADGNQQSPLVRFSLTKRRQGELR